MTLAQVKGELGEPDHFSPYVSKKYMALQAEYWEEVIGRNSYLEVNFVNNRFVSRRFGEAGIPYKGRPWDPDWKPVSEPPFPK